MTVMKLLVDAGSACDVYQDTTVKGIHARRVECDEIWSFCYAKQKNAEGLPGAGNLWTWVALDPDTKLIISWLVSPERDSESACQFIEDLHSRLANRIQLTTDGLLAYPEAVEAAFGGDIDYAQLVREAVVRDGADEVETEKRIISGNPDPKLISTSLIERHNLTTRMSLRRFTRKTNAFSKKFANHVHALALYFVWYNFVRPHSSLGTFTTPAMAAGLTETKFGFEWLVNLTDAYLKNPSG